MPGKKQHINNRRLVERFIELASIESPSLNEKIIVEYVSSLLGSMGIEVIVDNCGETIGGNAGNITAYFKNKNNTGGEPVFLCAHLDTVSLNGSVKPSVKDGKIINSNPDCILGADDKVAVAAILEAIQVITENNIPTGDIYLVFTVAEEIGLLGAKYLNMEGIKARYGFAFDSEGDIGTIINRAPFQDSIFVTFKGRAAHAGVEPEKGINSIKAASEAISAMNIGRIDSETTANVGKINGGVARNIVPEITKIEIEARSLNAGKLENTTKSIIKIMENSAGSNKASLKYRIVREYDGFEINPGEVPLKAAKNILEMMEIKPKIKSSGGGSDINIFNSRGKIAVNLSAGMEKVHTSSEFVRVSQLGLLGNLVLGICRYKI
ncbi:MAG: M20/M25/M40 family metallo-hydrolase [Actinobacteria bacterium]|nr:M20/M25/M40 family metallo-hydrolase [Actinomycetota bacterium]